MELLRGNDFEPLVLGAASLIRHQRPKRISTRSLLRLEVNTIRDSVVGLGRGLVKSKRRGKFRAVYAVIPNELNPVKE